MKRVAIKVGAEGCDTALASVLVTRFADVREIILYPDAAIAQTPLAGGKDVADLYGALRRLRAGIFLARNEQDVRTHFERRERFEKTKGEGPQTSQTSPLVWIGQGSNTWRSDLDLGIRYARTKGPANQAGQTLGIPWMVGIPGTVGGWIAMNAGAFGHSISEALEAVCVDGEWRSATDCGFGYRESAIRGEISDFRLRARTAIKAEATADEYRARRRRFPAGTYGSFFKNPPNDFAGRILDAAGAKRLVVGGASVWREHANVIVRGTGATPSDVLALSRLMRACAFASSGIWLEPEVRGL